MTTPLTVSHENRINYASYLGADLAERKEMQALFAAEHPEAAKVIEIAKEVENRFPLETQQGYREIVFKAIMQAKYGLMNI